MYPIFVVLHVVVCVLLCVVVLLQSSKGGGLAGAFGGGGGLPQQIFGSRGMTTILHKLTIWLAAGFFLTSSALFALSGRDLGGGARSVVREAAQEGRVTSDVTPPPSADVFDPGAALPGAAPGGASQAAPAAGEPEQNTGGGGQ